MSSSQPFVASSPIAPERKSRFTFRNLNFLAQSSTSCPLRVIAHIDLDAFYAQCEGIRLGIEEDQPLAVQQWQGLIAINYPAKAFGLSRHATITDAKKACPQIILQHVATWREGDDKWAYREDSAQHIHTDKVSLDPYRLESRKILATIKDALPAPPIQRVEKASIDEVFMDLSAQIHAILLEKYPELATAPYDDPTEHLPKPPITALDWHADALVDLDSSQNEDDDPDWDDVVMNIGSEIVRDVRKAVRDRLKYTCSAGIARNKMMAKLGSGYKKPNCQTIVRSRALQHFLSGFKFTKIRNLGGKLGDQVTETFGTDELTELLQIPIEQLKLKLGDETGVWLYGVIRGEDSSEVNSRTEIKSMLSAKSFRPSINSFEQGVKWLKIFVADIYARLVEEGVLENKRRPKTMTLHHRQSGQTRSKQLPIPAKKIDTGMLLEIAKTLLGQVIVDGRAWPCSNLSLAVGGFEDGVSGNREIDSFLVKAGDLKAVQEPASRSNTATPVQEESRPEKRRKLNREPNIQRFFTTADDPGEHDEEFGSSHNPEEAAVVVNRSQPQAEIEVAHQLHQQDITSYFCTKCQALMPLIGQEEHEDWHYAKELQAQDKDSAAGSSINHPPSANPKTTKTPVLAKPQRGSKPEKGQRRLAFG